MKKPTAKSLILDLLLAAAGEPLSARQAILACSIFDISVNNARVALVRLSAEGLIESAGRALYKLTEDAHALADDVAAWRTRPQRVRDWDGGYVCIQVDKLKRTDHKERRNRERALKMLGMGLIADGLYVRPSNLEDSIQTIRRRAYQLGLDQDALVFGANQFDADTDQRIRSLWNVKQLESNYLKFSEKMSEWLSRHEQLEPEVAARESFLLGGSAIKHVVYDPFLPDEWVNTGLRNRFFSLVEQVDLAGQRIWAMLWQQQAKTAV